MNLDFRIGVERSGIRNSNFESLLHESLFPTEIFSGWSSSYQNPECGIARGLTLEGTSHTNEIQGWEEGLIPACTTNLSLGRQAGINPSSQLKSSWVGR